MHNSMCTFDKEGVKQLEYEEQRKRARARLDSAGWQKLDDAEKLELACEALVRLKEDAVNPRFIEELALADAALSFEAGKTLKQRAVELRRHGATAWRKGATAALMRRAVQAFERGDDEEAARWREASQMVGRLGIDVTMGAALGAEERA
jgi:hypothetical protein